MATAEGGTNGGTPKRVLVVDDDRNMRFLAGRILRDAGYEVDFASDGVSALAKVAQSPPDLVILDITLPNIDGRGVLRYLKDLAKAPPVLVLTAHGQHFTGSDTVRQQAAGLMAKPFSLKDLLATCERILRAS
jgi:DNA-binding response OmpR family regulator